MAAMAWFMAVLMLPCASVDMAPSCDESLLLQLHSMDLTKAARESSSLQNFQVEKNEGKFSALRKSTSAGHVPSSLALQEGSIPPNAAGFVTEKGVDFGVETSTPFLIEAISNRTIVEEQNIEISSSLGLTMKLTNMKVVGAPKIEMDVNLDGTGIAVMVHVDLDTTAGVSIPSPQSTGSMGVKFKGAIGLTLDIGMKDGKLTFHASQYTVTADEMTVSFSWKCKRNSFFDYASCLFIEGLNGQVPSFLVDMFKGMIQDTLEGEIQKAINDDLSEDFAKMPMALPIPDFGQGHRLQVNFTPVSIHQSHSMKTTTMQLLVVDLESDKTYPVPGINLSSEEGTFNQSMLGLAFSASPINSLFWAVYETGALSYTVLPSMLPKNSVIGLDTNAISALFWAPWLKMMYSLTCPFWKPCPIQLTITAADAPEIHLQGDVLLHVPVMMDFSVMYDNKTDFLWRLETTLKAGASVSIEGNKSVCGDESLQLGLSDFSLDWMDVTKTQEDSWVSLAYSLNLAVTSLLDDLLVPELKDRISQGVPLKPMNIGSTSLQLDESDLNVGHGAFKFRTNIIKERQCE